MSIVKSPSKMFSKIFTKCLQKFSLQQEMCLFPFVQKERLFPLHCSQIKEANMENFLDHTIYLTPLVCPKLQESKAIDMKDCQKGAKPFFSFKNTFKR